MRNPPSSSADAKAFGYHPKLPALVARSQATLDARQREKDLELKRTREYAEERARVATRLRRALIALAVLVVVAIIVAGYALEKKKESEEAAKDATRERAKANNSAEE